MEDCVKGTLTDFLGDERGDDLIEYALLCGLMGAIGVVAFPDIADKMSAAYSEWVSSAKDAWEPCPPAPASCP
jgi:Flp pilus assembly pilin Flp